MTWRAERRANIRAIIRANIRVWVRLLRTVRIFQNSIVAGSETRPFGQLLNQVGDAGRISACEPLDHDRFRWTHPKI